MSRAFKNRQKRLKKYGKPSSNDSYNKDKIKRDLLSYGKPVMYDNQLCMVEA